MRPSLVPVTGETSTPDKLLVREQVGLKAYILAAVGSIHDMEDLFQEVSLVVSRRASDFEPGSDFHAWVHEIARRCILQHFRRKPKGRERLEPLDRAYRELAESEWISLRREALRECLEGLPSISRKVIEGAYSRGWSMNQIAETIGKGVQASYSILKRARGALRACVERKLKGVGK